MRWLWILPLLLILLLSLRIGMELRLGAWSARLRLGPLRIQLFPRRSKPVKKKRKEKKKPKKPKKPKDSQAKPRLKLTAADLREAAAVLGPPLRKTLRRTRRGIRVHPMQVSVTVGGRSDPAAAAELYGCLHAIVWGGMPLAEQLMRIPSPGVHIGIDFSAEETQWSGEIGLTLRLGTLFRLGAGFGIPMFKWLLAWQKHAANADMAKQV